MLNRLKWTAIFLALCIAGIFYLHSSHDWIVVERAMSENEPSLDFPNDLSLLSLDGEEITLNKFQGEKMIVFFFTSWCQICAEQWNEFQQASDELNEMGVHVIAINLTKEERNISSVESYVEKIGSTEILIVLDTKGEAQKQFRVIGIPTSFVINEKGELENRTEGLLTAEKIIQIIED